MYSHKKVARDKPLLTDHEMVGDLLMISAVSKALARSIVLKSTKMEGKNGGRGYDRKKKSQCSGS